MWAYIIIAFVAGAFIGAVGMVYFMKISNMISNNIAWYNHNPNNAQAYINKLRHHLRLVLSRLPQKVWSKCYTQDERNEIMDVAYPDNMEGVE